MKRASIVATLTSTLSRRISKVFLIIGFSVFFGLIRNVVLARELSQTEMGIYTLAMTIVGFVYPLTLLGQQSAVVRFFSQNALETYNWGAIIKAFAVVCVTLTMVTLLGAHEIYDDLSPAVLLFIFVLIFTTAITELQTSITRAKGDYEKSIFLLRSVRYVDALFMLILYWLRLVDLSTVIIVLALIHILHFIITTAYTNGTTRVGVKSIPRSVYADGFVFLGLDVSFITIASIDRFLIAKFATLEELAAYFTVITLTRLFDLAVQAIEYVLIPHSNKMQTIKLPTLVGTALTVAAALTCFYLAVGAQLMDVLFKGKYPQGAVLIPWFCAVGSVRMLHAIPLSLIYGRLQQVALKLLLSTNLILLVVNVGLALFFISKYKLVGAVIATLIVWCLRTGAAYYFMMRFMDTRLKRTEMTSSEQITNWADK